jgi:hypothetical protein
MSQMNNVIDILSTALNDLKSQYKAQAVPKQDYDVQEAINKIAPLLEADTYFNVKCELRQFSRDQAVEIKWTVYIEGHPSCEGPTLAVAVNAMLEHLSPAPEPIPQPENPITSFNEAMQPVAPMPY